MTASKILVALVVLLFSAFALSAQTLRGTVRAADDGGNLPGAVIIVWQKDMTKPEGRAFTDINGQFVFEKLPPGYYRLKAAYTGYEDFSLAELLVTAGKELVVEVTMSIHPGLICAEPVISAKRREPQPLSEIQLPRERVFRYPAMFFDPARLAAASAGVVQTNDGINGMSIRGNGPASVQWRLEGVEIVNPNHLPNAGTFSDQPTAASGGVLMFSAQMLDNASLLTGAFPTEYGNALGGIMDMGLRAGNNYRHEFTAQASLVGLDLAAEGPFGRNGATAGRRGADRPSYLANYRYSTVGLLGQMGVSFGDESINFQDLSFTTYFPGRRGGYFKVFGMGGLSENHFSRKTDTSEIKTNKDWQDIDFQSKTGLIGVSGMAKLGSWTGLRAAVIVSGQENDWRRVSYRDSVFNNGYVFFSGSRIQTFDSKWTVSTSIEHRFSPGFVVRGGSQAIVLGEYYGLDAMLVQPWAELAWSLLGGRVMVKPGLHMAFWTDKGGNVPQLRLNMAWWPNAQHAVAAFVGSVSSLNPLSYRYAQKEFTLSQQTSLRYRFRPSDKWNFHAEIFAQKLSNVLTFGDSSLLSQLNEPQPSLSFLSIGFTGEGQNKGIELSAERLFTGGWFASANVTLLDSRYRNAPDVAWQSTRWDVGHILNLAGGKEWVREKNALKTKTFGFSARAVWTGGFREMPIDLATSRKTIFGETAFDEKAGLTVQLPDYFRVDGRVYWKKSLAERRNSTFALEIQNMTNQQNVAWHFYDRQTDKVETKYQLGLIPNISWRLEF